MAVDSPEVTVVIPTRNRWPLAERAVRSALGQLNIEVEVLVVDDGSDTRSPASLASDQLEVVRLRPSGVAAARNAGIERSTARWVSFLDDDDLWAPQRLRRMVDEAKTRDAEFVYSSALMVDPELNPLMLDPAPPPQRLPDLLRDRKCNPRWRLRCCGIGGVDRSIRRVRRVLFLPSRLGTVVAPQPGQPLRSSSRTADGLRRTERRRSGETRSGGLRGCATPDPEAP